MNKQERIQRYQMAYRDDRGFEAVMVAARQQAVLELLESRRPATVIEIGCADELLVEKACARSFAGSWIIVEPAAAFAAGARNARCASARISVVEGFVEDVVQQVRDLCPGGADVIVCASLLHEVPDERALLCAVRSLAGPETLVHFNVPNALSFHRRLARAMGLIADEHEASPRNKELLQHRVYDPDSLRRAVESAGFMVESSGGYLIKPFTHAQMEQVRAVVSDKVLDGLWQLGRELPDLASEIWVNARISA